MMIHLFYRAKKRWTILAINERRHSFWW